MKHIECPEVGDPAVLADGTEGTVTNTTDASYIVDDNVWQLDVNIGSEADGDQILRERLAAWRGGKWTEVT